MTAEGSIEIIHELSGTFWQKDYILPPLSRVVPMSSRIQGAALAAIHQLTIAIGLVMLPFAVALRQILGITIPVHRIIDPIRRAYDAERH